MKSLWNLHVIIKFESIDIFQTKASMLTFFNLFDLQIPDILNSYRKKGVHVPRTWFLRIQICWVHQRAPFSKQDNRILISSKIISQLILAYTTVQGPISTKGNVHILITEATTFLYCSAQINGLHFLWIRNLNSYYNLLLSFYLIFNIFGER